jgi:hypothetical protein
MIFAAAWGREQAKNPIQFSARQTPDRGTMMGHQNDLAEAVLLCVAEIHEEVRAAPPPPKWRAWDYDRYQENLEFGPPYSTIRWFGALAASEAQRVACLRTVYRLADAGLLKVVKNEWGSKVERVKLTDRGEEVVNQLRTCEPATESAPPRSEKRLSVGG